MGGQCQTKQEVPIYIMWPLQYIHDHLLKGIAFAERCMQSGTHQ